jgi:hypothetical protein
MNTVVIVSVILFDVETGLRPVSTNYRQTES